MAGPSCPKNPKVRFLAAQWHYRRGRSEEAAKLLDELLAADPRAHSVLIQRGRVAIDLQQLPDAEHWLPRALSRPPLAEANAVMADCLRLIGRSDEARSYQDKVKMLLERKRNANVGEGKIVNPGTPPATVAPRRGRILAGAGRTAADTCPRGRLLGLFACKPDEGKTSSAYLDEEPRPGAARGRSVVSRPDGRLGHRLHLSQRRRSQAASP